MPAAPPIVVDILNAVVRWRKTRVVLKRVLDSRSATDSSKADAKRAYQDASDKLEVLAAQLEKAVKLQPKRKGKPVPWRELLGGLASVVQIMDNASKAQLDGMPRTKDEWKRAAGRTAGTVNEDGSINAEVIDDD